MGSQEQLFIKKLEISGYRSFKHAVWEPGALNLVVGPNGSGKSNLLRLLALISDTADGKLAKSITDSGGIVPILWDHQPGSFGWSALLGGSRRPKDGHVRDATYELTLQQVGRGSAYSVEYDSLVYWNEPISEFGSGDNTGYRRDSQGKVVRRATLKGRTLNFPTDDDYDKNESFISERNSSLKTVLQSWTLHQDI